MHRNEEEELTAKARRREVKRRKSGIKKGGLSWGVTGWLAWKWARARAFENESKPRVAHEYMLTLGFLIYRFQRIEKMRNIDL